MSSKWSDNEAQSVFRSIFDQMKHDEGNVNVRSPPLEIALKSVLLQLDFQTFVFNDSNLALWINAIDKYLQWSIAEDIKLPYLKNLQALIWEAGYSNGDLIGHLFADVAPQLALFYRQGVKIYIYSSGSRRAQKLLFQHSSQGDITYLLSGFFDTSIGSKMDVASYESIGLSIGLTNSDTLFITDLVPEAIAAKSAGFQVILSDRPGNSSLEGNHGFEVISSLTSLST